MSLDLQRRLPRLLDPPQAELPLEVPESAPATRHRLRMALLLAAMRHGLEARIEKQERTKSK